MKTDTYAIIDDSGTVINVTVWDGESEWTPPDNTTAVKCGDSGAGIGWSYKDGVFTPPPAPEVPKSELIAQVVQQKTSLIAEASQSISILQDAVDLDMATEDEKNQLTAWKKYRVLLNRVDTSTAPDIPWPDKP
ncbi:MAG: tail fiber assembly protein [Pantoea sp.]|uniref:tail fiber assembly protein n=1 Tax=Pantoea sp. TaxID=69393 RepID=UPI0028ABD95F|nr:tail fiber assembly protein [Pantoea sp.]MDU7837696.1 tail fiber assembly protein [Pantoea sp.]